MYCVRNVTEDLYWVGANDHRLTLFENIHPIPRGVSYNAYLLLDEKTVLFDTVDWSACRQLLENMDYLLQGKALPNGVFIFSFIIIYFYCYHLFEKGARPPFLRKAIKYILIS